jgi:WhiB family redox-sensing transcriptional regulator
MSAASVLWEPRTGWRVAAACKGFHASIFFPPDGAEGKQERQRREAMAKEVCALCPVCAQCREYALRVREPYGVWGGLSESDRRALLASGA